jgi:predicted acetyltransferase
MPQLTLPSVTVQDSFLAGERAMCADEGVPADWLDAAAADFASFAAGRAVTRLRWGVPVTELWYTEGDCYIGTVMIRHELTPDLRREGGHIGYHVVPGYRRRGHATGMLAQACALCRTRGMRRLLVTCASDNVGSRRVIEANAGVLDSVGDGVRRYWIALSPAPTPAT